MLFVVTHDVVLAIVNPLRNFKTLRVMLFVVTKICTSPTYGNRNFKTLRVMLFVVTRSKPLFFISIA